MFDIRKARQAIAEEGLSGWLFSNLRHRDAISDRILEIPKASHNTRPWIYLVPPHGQPVRLVHAIEAGILDHLPGRKLAYDSRESFRQGLREMGATEIAGEAGGKRRAPRRAETVADGKVAAQFSPDLPVLSFLDHGTAQLLKSCGFKLVSSASLIQRFLGVLGPEGIESHEEAAHRLYAIVSQVWARLRVTFRERLESNRRPLTEGEVQRWIAELFERDGLESDFPPLVAAGRNTADPHYTPQGAGEPLLPGEVVQLDIWARRKEPGSIYADISWVGVLAAEPPIEVKRAFEAVRDARELAVSTIAAGLKAGTGVRGMDVDRAVRAFLKSRGFGEALRHRTGHAIDSEVHGYGVNLDSTEFPDDRLILEGSCFSVEPGVYPGPFGVRTEIDAYVRRKKLIVSGGAAQVDLLCVY